MLPSSPRISEFEDWSKRLDIEDEAVVYVHEALSNNVVRTKGKRDSSYTGLIYIYGEVEVWQAMLLFLNEFGYIHDFTTFLRALE